MPRDPSKSQEHSRGLMLIAVFKIFKGVVLLAVGLGALRLIHRDAAAQLLHWINFFRVDPENIFIHRLIAKFSELDDHKLREFSIGTFIYSALLLTEGTGLAFRKRWAEYFTIIMTGSFIPLEIWELYRHTSEVRIIILIINVAIVVYLIYEVRRNRRRTR
jgi:uncharacterized membrane protein (DUF2068 family)